MVSNIVTIVNIMIHFIMLSCFAVYLLPWNLLNISGTLLKPKQHRHQHCSFSDISRSYLLYRRFYHRKHHRFLSLLLLFSDEAEEEWRASNNIGGFIFISNVITKSAVNVATYVLFLFMWQHSWYHLLSVDFLFLSWGDIVLVVVSMEHIFDLIIAIHQSINNSIVFLSR